MRGGWRIGRIGGVEVRIESSLLFLAGLITYDLWLFFSDDRQFPELRSPMALVLALLTALLFVGSILAHELAHAAAFRARGIEVRGITLYMFGGLTAAKSEARRPWDEFLVTVVGPLTTAALGFIFLGLHVLGMTTMSRAWRAMFGYLALLNLAMALFNVIPGFPLDGGRLLLSLVWRITGSRIRAIRVAARVGQGMALLIVVGGLAAVVARGEPFGLGLWPVLVGAMLYQGASAALADADRRTTLGSATAADVMSPPPPSVPADITVGLATERFLAGHEGEVFPVVDDRDGGGVIGFISARMASAAPPDRPVREAMIGTEAVATAGPGETMTEVVERVRDRGAQMVLVVDDGRLVGVIEQEDLARLFRRANRRRGGSAPPPPLPRGPVGLPARPDQPQEQRPAQDEGGKA